MRIWPLAAFAVYLQPAGTFPYHSLQGLALPLVGAGGAGRRVAARARLLARPAVVVALLFLMTVPGLRAQARGGGEQRPRGRRPVLHLPRRAAGAWLRSRTTRGRAGCSRRSTPASWSRTRPGARPTSARCPGRRTSARGARRPTRCSRAAWSATRALDFVRSTRARFLYADCRKLADLTRAAAARARARRPLRLRDRLRAARAPVHGARGGAAGLLSRPRRRRSRRCSSAAAAFSALTMLKGIQPNDEGLMLQARRADRRRAGAVLGLLVVLPAGPALPARPGSSELFGPSLLTWRVVRVLVNAAVVVLVYVLARRAAPRGVSLVAALVACGAMAFPSGPHPFPIALACALGALLAIERPALAGRARRGVRGVADRVRGLRGAGGAGGLRAASAGGRAARARRRVFAGVLGRRRARPVRAGRAGRGGRRLVGPADRLPAHRLHGLPVAAVPARLRRAAQHERGRRLLLRLGRGDPALLPAARAGARAARVARGAAPGLVARSLVAGRRRPCSRWG